MKINPKTRVTILYFYHKMFSGKPARYRGLVIPLKVRHGLKQFQVRSLLFIEQNKKKATKWAKMAMKNHNIMWVISLPDNKYLYQVVDGRINTLKDFKTSPWIKKIQLSSKRKTMVRK